MVVDTDLGGFSIGGLQQANVYEEAVLKAVQVMVMAAMKVGMGAGVREPRKILLQRGLIATRSTTYQENKRLLYSLRMLVEGELVAVHGSLLSRRLKPR
jgi:hypothetical protein